MNNLCLSCFMFGAAALSSKVFVHLWFGASFLSSVDLLSNFFKCIQYPEVTCGCVATTSTT